MNRLVPGTLALALFACGQAKSPDHPTANAGGEPVASAEPGAGDAAGNDAAGNEAAEADAAGADTGTPAEGGEGDRVFQVSESDTAKDARGEKPSKIKPTKTEAALRLFVIDKDKGPIKGIVMSLTSPSGAKFYTEETDGKGYAEVLVPVGETYKISYLSLGRKDISAKVTVSDKPNQNLKLTLRYKREEYPDGGGASAGRFVLKGVQFETGKATLTPDSFARLDGVVEFMTHKKSARIEISGHTDNVGNPRRNKTLSEKRAKACRDYLVSKGIAADRIKTVGYGDERPIASNDTEAGRQQNRRIEATEL